VIDGHHRQKIAKHHDLPCPSEVRAGFTDTEKRGIALSLNVNRRHLTREQRRALVTESIKADPQLSDRAHGRRTGVDHKTATVVRDELEANGEIPQSSERVTAEGKPAPRPKPKPPAPQLKPPRKSFAAVLNYRFLALSDDIGRLDQLIRSDRFGRNRIQLEGVERIPEILHRFSVRLDAIAELAPARGYRMSIDRSDEPPSAMRPNSSSRRRSHDHHPRRTSASSCNTFRP
jgi:hypothetical protein